MILRITTLCRCVYQKTSSETITRNLATRKFVLPSFGPPGFEAKMTDDFKHLKLHGKVSAYRSIEINLDEQVTQQGRALVESRSGQQLTNALKECMEEYRKQDLQGMWLCIPKHLSWAVPAAIEAGLDYHHAQPEKVDSVTREGKGSYVMLTKWLNESRENSHPIYAHHFLGVGGLVVNEKNEILTIREKYMGDLNNKYSSYWKLPGGHVDPKEDFGQAAEREVLEETGIKANFKGILAFRHMHNYRFGCSDIYICCLLSVTDSSEQTITPSQYEVHECKWVPVEDYPKLNLSQLNQMYFKQYLQYKKTGVFINFGVVQNIHRKYQDKVYFCEPGNGSV